MKEPKTEERTTEAPVVETEEKLSKEFTDGIIEEVKNLETPDESPEPKPEKKKELPSKEKESPSSDEEQGGKSPEVEKEIEKVKEVVEDGIPDDLLTRAVKAGIGLSDARDFKNADALERMCEALESRSPDKEKETELSGEDSASEDDLFKDFPELSRDDYDEGIVDAFEGMKGIIKNLAKENKTLRETSTAGKETDSVDQSIDRLGDDYKAVIDPAVRSKIKTQFDILVKGYEAAGEKVDKDVILDSALRIVVGDVKAVNAAKESATAAALAKRESLTTVPPSSQQQKPSGTPEEEAERALAAKFPDI